MKSLPLPVQITKAGRKYGFHGLSYEYIYTQLAIEMFCYQAKKHLGALIAVLGGIDVLVFTGGIGEKAAEIRKAICTYMEYAGIEINETLNENNDFTISAEDSNTMVHVIATDEEYAIAQHVIELI